MTKAAQANILVADDDRSIRWVLREALVSDGHHVHEATTGVEALTRLEEGDIDVAFLDIRMPQLSGLEVLSEVQQKGCQTPIIVMTAQLTMNNAITAMSSGGYDYLPKPFYLEDVRELLGRALRSREGRVGAPSEIVEDGTAPEGTVEIVGNSPAMQDVFKLVGRAASSNATVLVQGESGTGKELVARVLHGHSGRRAGPFVALNCSAIPGELLESELFGHEKGSFTGAEDRRVGLLESAAGGTLFLDEIGDMALELQSKLLRVLQEREFQRVGGRETIRADVRVVAATNQPLGEQVKKGSFREDLFFRLNVIPVRLPPLRERRSDIPLLARHLISRINADLGTAKQVILPEAEQALLEYSWPGNVRELENTLIRAAVLSPGPQLSVQDLRFPRSIPSAGQGEGSLTEIVRACAQAKLDGQGGGMLNDLYARLLDEFENPLLQAVLARTDGNQSRAAQILGINRNTLRKKLLHHGLASRIRDELRSSVDSVRPFSMGAGA